MPDARQPDDLGAIQSLRPDGPRRLAFEFDESTYREKLQGALLARAAGCTLGAIVENWSIDAMRAHAAKIGDVFPPVDYWSDTTEHEKLRYGKNARSQYIRGKLNGVPVDDDLAYTVLNLLIVEQYGPDFTPADVGAAWLEHLPMACTAEDVALKNLKKGIDARKAAEIDNPYSEWIGADIRCDPFGYLAPGWPQKAAMMAYHDAYLSHRGNGIYGSMFFAAAIAAAFVVDDPIEAIRIGLTEIPRDCDLAQAVRWALDVGPTLNDFVHARQLVDQRFPGMHPVHTINNACLTIFGLFLGRQDVTRVVGLTVAMGLDNDCTAATAGSLVGAVVGKASVPAHWYRPFGNTMHSYLIGHEAFAINDLMNRFTQQAKRVSDF